MAPAAPLSVVLPVGVTPKAVGQAGREVAAERGGTLSGVLYAGALVEAEFGGWNVKVVIAVTPRS